MSRARGRSSSASTLPASTSTRRRGSPTAASSAWARRSATRRRSCTRAARSACASSARTSTSSRATGTSADPAPPMRLGILGGSFNPPHVGHLLMAQEAHAQLGLDKVVLMPVASPPHKRLEDDPGPEERYEMTRLAVAKDDRLEVSRLEIDRGGPSYTADTLREIHATAAGDELVLIVGGDMAHSLPAWREHEAVPQPATPDAPEGDGV